MKNKHLVLFFLTILAGGWIFRRYPLWRGDDDFDREIVRLDTAATFQIVLQNPDTRETLVFDRHENGWAVTSETKTLVLPASKISPILAPLTGLHAVRILPEKTDNQSLALLHEKNSLHLRFFSAAGKQEDLFVEKCRPEATNAILRLGAAPEQYEVAQPLGCLFSLRFEDFRSKKILHQPEQPSEREIVELSFNWPDAPPLFFQKKDGAWFAPGNAKSLSDNEVRAFFEALDSLQWRGFADAFDDARERELLVGKLALSFYGEPQQAVLRCFLSEKAGRRFVLHSSENPENHVFADDSLLERIFLRPQHWLRPEGD